MFKPSLALSSLCILLSAAPALAGPKAMLPEGAGPDKRTLEERSLEFSNAIGNRLDRAAETIDITLAGRKYTRKANETSLTINQYLTSMEGGIVKTSTDFGLNLRLPNLERRWQLRFTSYDEEEENRDLSQQRVRTRPRQTDYGASLLFFEKLGRVKTTFQPRLLLKDPLDLRYVLRFESSTQSKHVRILPRFDFFADPRKGTGQFFGVDVIVELSKRSDLTLQNSEEYQDRENRFTTQHGISYDYSLTDRKAVGASFNLVSTNHNFHLSSETAALLYTEQLIRRLLKYTLSPFLTFGKSDHFKGKAGVTLNLELVF